MSQAIVIKTDLSTIDGRRSIRLSLATFCSFEAMFLLFLMAGRYKGDPRFQWIAERFSLDLTAMFLAVSGMAGLVVLFGRGYRLPRGAGRFMTAAAALFGYMILSLLWTSGDAYAHTKALHIGVLTTWTAVATGLVIASQRRRVERFLLLLVLFAVWLSVESLMAHSQSGDGTSVAALGGNYLGLGRVIGPAALVALGYGLFMAKSTLARALGFAVAAVFVFVLLILGGRMPLLATAAGGLVPLVLAARSASINRHRQALWAYVALLITAAATIFYIGCGEQAPQTLRRMAGLFQSDWGTSSFARWQYYQAAVEYWWQRPFMGHGLGAWPVLHFQGDFRAYPHNLLLETLVEFGLCGLGLLAWLFLAAKRGLGSMARVGADPLRVIVLMVAVNALANAMVSGDISDNRFLFGALGLMLLPSVPAIKAVRHDPER
ncbi:MAG: O-antigen ligase family protein, partial [Planctomycetota bacterium]|nr:O-antigen ligase family protein [Planctomycetota bacterium]